MRRPTIRNDRAAHLQLKNLLFNSRDWMECYKIPVPVRKIPEKYDLSVYTVITPYQKSGQGIFSAWRPSVPTNGWKR
ncbi:hypothetical protein OAF34_06660 [Pirellulaceae bacterium]|nr:hypothetical protein [Pirellulaceae bacterium]